MIMSLNPRKSHPRLNALAAAVVLAIGVTGAAYGQSTTGAISGTAPATNGEAVVITNASGVTRKVPVTNGRFVADNLPFGHYIVTLQRNGETVATKPDVTVTVGANTTVRFATATAASSASNPTKLATVQVTANAVPTIDVSNVNSQTVITAEQLQRLPIAHNAEAIALLAPGTVQGSPRFGNLISFGGSSVIENAYYINGFNTTDALNGEGGLTLPYNTIAQQQILTGGYGARYGRSDGGVISQVGKKGTNEWHFGGQIRWVPKEPKADPINQYRPDGSLQAYRNDNKSWQMQYSAYAGGPIVKNHLFIFASAEFDKTKATSIGSITSQYKYQTRTETPSYYADIQWNINDSNILEVTGVRDVTESSGNRYAYDYLTHTEGPFLSQNNYSQTTSKLWIANYTSYITDNITLTALYGKLRRNYLSAVPGYDPTLVGLAGVDNQNPLITGGTPITNAQTVYSITDPRHRSSNTNLRVNLSWRIGNHTITAGIDNQTSVDLDDGSKPSGPGYYWVYQAPEPGGADAWITGGPLANGPNWQQAAWVMPAANFPNGASGYYAYKFVFQDLSSSKVVQRAQYVQDDWRVTDNFLLSLGLRNDQFTNYNPGGAPYIRQTKPQWAPRIGFSWDVNGDSSFKVFGNAGRYYLTMPDRTSERMTSASIYTKQYYTYSAIGPDGAPTGLTEITTSTGGPISSSLEYGILPDPKTVESRNLTAEYQDEYILGFEKRLGSSWVYGAKGTYRKLRNYIDDVDDAPSLARKMVQMGLIDQATASQYLADGTIPGLFLFNPDKTNIFRIKNPAGGYYIVPMSMADFGFKQNVKRAYGAVDLFLEHPFDGKWFGKVEYVWSHSYGNTEGGVRSDLGQNSGAISVDWDYWQVMSSANGDLPNDRRNQLKLYGSYQINPEWMLSANLMITSGSPRSCDGLFGPDKTNPSLGYGAGNYHWCDGEPYPPGTNHNPWQKILSLGVGYRPAFARGKLAFRLNVYNLFDEQTVTQAEQAFNTGPFYNSTTGIGNPMATDWTTPRYFSLSVSYNY